MQAWLKTRVLLSAVRYGTRHRPWLPVIISQQELARNSRCVGSTTCLVVRECGIVSLFCFRALDDHHNNYTLLDLKYAIGSLRVIFLSFFMTLNRFMSINAGLFLHYDDSKTRNKTTYFLQVHLATDQQDSSCCFPKCYHTHAPCNIHLHITGYLHSSNR